MLLSELLSKVQLIKSNKLQAYAKNMEFGFIWMHALEVSSLQVKNSEARLVVVKMSIPSFGIHTKAYLCHFKLVYSSLSILESCKIVTQLQLTIFSINKENHMIIL